MVDNFETGNCESVMHDRSMGVLGVMALFALAVVFRATTLGNITFIAF